MTTLQPRLPYTKEELAKLYPSGLQLQLVQVIMRHGERTPVASRFRNAGLPAYWPYCKAANQLRSVIMTSGDAKSWDNLEWRRRLETFGKDDGPALASGVNGEIDGVCTSGELTDQGRATTRALGTRLRHLYVDQLGFMPAVLPDADMIYMRATPIVRALESVQQAFTGIYPPAARTATFPAPTIILRTPGDETLFPNDSQCRRFNQLSRAFAQRTAERWNNSPDMDYVNKMIGKWMPEDSPRAAVDSHPRLSGILDTVNSTLAHPAPTRLPPEFYDQRLRDILNRVNMEEWFSGYMESAEYRQVGIGGLAGDIVERMVGSAEHNNTTSGDGLAEIVPLANTSNGKIVGRGNETAVRLCLSGAHDTTLSAILTSLGTFEGHGWPPYTSHVAFELFKKQQPTQLSSTTGATQPVGIPPQAPSSISVLWNRLLGRNRDDPIARRPFTQLSDEEKSRLDGYFVRIRYNDEVMKVPGCSPEGNHLPGDDSFCTLEAFKKVVDAFTPRNWRDACVSNLDKPKFPEKPEPAGW